MAAKGHASTIGVGCQYDPGRSRVEGIGCWCVAASLILRTWPTTPVLVRETCRWRNWRAWPALGGSSKTPSRRPSRRWGWTSIRCAGGSAGTGTSPWPMPFWRCPGPTPPVAMVKRGYVPGRTHPTDRARGQTTAMSAAVAAPWQSQPDHPLVRLETAASGPGHAVSLPDTPSETFTACATVILGASPRKVGT